MSIDNSQPERYRGLNFGASLELSGASNIPAGRQDVPPELIAPGDLMPDHTAQKLVEWSIAKSSLCADRLIALGLLAGALIAIGGAFFTGVMDVSSLGQGPSRLLGGIVFSSGLLLVCVSGAELSTGNCMLFSAWASRRLTLAEVGRNLAISYAANVACALVFAMLIAKSGLLQSGYGHTAAAIAEAKMNLSFEHAFVRGILCNALVCIAVWTVLAARTIPSKLAGLIFPIRLSLRSGSSIQSQTSTSYPSVYWRAAPARSELP